MTPPPIPASYSVACNSSHEDKCSTLSQVVWGAFENLFIQNKSNALVSSSPCFLITCSVFHMFHTLWVQQQALSFVETPEIPFLAFLRCYQHHQWQTTPCNHSCRCTRWKIPANFVKGGGVRQSFNPRNIICRPHRSAHRKHVTGNALWTWGLVRQLTHPSKFKHEGGSAKTTEVWRFIAWPISSPTPQHN